MAEDWVCPECDMDLTKQPHKRGCSRSESDTTGEPHE